MSQNTSTKIKKIKWGIAGCGWFAEHTFIPALIQLRKSILVSLYSKTNSRAKAVADKFGASKYFSDYDEFLKSDINAVYISSANVDHYEQVLKAAKAKKHILCEKPLSITSNQAEEMVKTCLENDVMLAVNYLYRTHPLIKKAKELIDGQILGKLVSINMSFNSDFPPGSNFRFKKELSGGGVLRDLGTHMIDLLRLFGGEIDYIDGVIDNIIYKSEVEDFASAIVRFNNGGYGYFKVSGNNRKAFNRIEILGHKGAVSIDNLVGVKNVPAKLTIMLEGEAKKAFRKRSNRMLRYLKAVQNSFLKNETPPATGYDGLINIKLIEELESKCQSRKD